MKLAGLGLTISSLVFSGVAFAGGGTAKNFEQICTALYLKDVAVIAECAESSVTVRSYTSSEIELAVSGMSRGNNVSISLRRTSSVNLQPVLFDRFSRFLAACEEDDICSSSDVRQFDDAFYSNCLDKAFEAEVFQIGYPSSLILLDIKIGNALVCASDGHFLTVFDDSISQGFNMSVEELEAGKGELDSLQIFGFILTNS